MKNINYSFATTENKERIRQLLKESNLPGEDIGDHLNDFIVARDNGELVGVVGLEVYGNITLLRSLAVKLDYRGKGIAKELYLRIVAHASLQGTEDLYLLTETTEKFFAKLGFTSIDREKLPETIKETEEFRSLCPSTAVCMTKNISNEVQYFPSDVLRLHPVIPGANMWAIALKKSMFTYFEIEPNSRFEMHHHESEQITMVLEGILFFEMNGKTTLVHSGEVVAIPSNVSHAAYTKEEPVKAVDAWSPVREEYKNQKIR